jgi:hypothetical protein
MATRIDYKTLVQKEVDDESAGNETLILNMIRETYQEVVAEIAPYINGFETEDVAVTSATVTPTKSWEEIKTVHYLPAGGTTWMELGRVREEDYDINDTTTVPSKYLIRGNTIILIGSPTSGSIRIKGMEVIPELDDDAEVSIIPDRFSRVIVLGAVYRFLGYEKDPAAENYFVWYQQAKQNMLQQLTTKAPVIRPSLY